MMNPEIVFYIIKLIVNGIVSFFAILLMSKMRSTAWVSIVCGFLSGYAGTVWEILIELGILSKGRIFFIGLPLESLLFLIVPAIFFTAGFILMITRKGL